MKILVVPAFLLIVVSSSLVSDEMDTGLFAPFVSRLNVESNGSEVILSWTDPPASPDIVYSIRRYGRKITTENLEESRTLAVIARGVRTFTDRPREGIPWWYAVVTVKNGETLDLIIPWRNSLGAPITVHTGTADIPNSANLLALTAELSGSTVFLSYLADRGEREITIFRSTEPITGPESLDHVVSIGNGIGESGTLEDRPLSGVSWYYAAVDSEIFNSGNPIWFEKAAFSLPVSLSLDIIRDLSRTQMRTAPLPLLRITKSVSSGEPIGEINGEMPDRALIGNETISALGMVLDPDQGRLWIKPEPEIMWIDSGHSDDRKQQNLKLILEGSFRKGDWAAAEAELFSLSSSNGLNPSTKARIQFYMGQCQYFQNNPQSAFLSFLVASDLYYPAARRWMLRIYKDLTPLS